MDLQISQWLDTLSKEAGFEQWSKATWTVYPLGPGTHSWIILLKSGAEEIGYLVAASGADGSLKLVEYGQGQNPLFSMNTLYQSMVQRELIPASLSLDSFLKDSPVKLTRWYIPPLQAVWEVDTESRIYYLDAKSGQELPDISAWLTKEKVQEHDTLSPPGPYAESTVTDSAILEPFDPFTRPSWLKGSPLPALDFRELKALLNEPDTQITYSGKWYGGIALYPLAVSGFHLWSSSAPYIRLEHEGSRFIPLQDAAKLGHFYTGT
jgi:hypothetical protein